MPQQTQARQQTQCHKTKIGGQALLEGIMMRGVHKTAMAVRSPDQQIKVEVWENKQSGSLLSTIKKIPFIRGSFAMAESMLTGYRCMLKSAEIAGGSEQEEQPSRLEQWLEKVLGGNLTKAISWIGGILGVVLSVILFMLLPSWAVWGIDTMLVPLGPWRGLLEGLIKIAVFVGYLAAVGMIPDMRRVFQYHGGEHKTIFCFESGESLTVENVRKQTRFHPRCGTSFVILVLIISILVFSAITWSSPLIRTLLKLLLLPVVVGIAYECIRVAGRYDNLLTRIISFPGVQLQRLTTKEPDDEQIAVAIASIEPVLPNNLEEDQW